MVDQQRILFRRQDTILRNFRQIAILSARRHTWVAGPNDMQTPSFVSPAVARETAETPLSSHPLGPPSILVIISTTLNPPPSASYLTPHFLISRALSSVSPLVEDRQTTMYFTYLYLKKKYNKRQAAKNTANPDSVEPNSSISSPSRRSSPEPYPPKAMIDDQGARGDGGMVKV